MNSNAKQSFKDLSDTFLSLFSGGEVPPTPVGVRMIPKGLEVPKGSAEPEEYTGTPWCQAVRLAAIENETVIIDKTNVGCPAAAIALGLVDAQDPQPLEGKRRYTDLMTEGGASPADFTNGLVYACKDSGNMRFALFGNEDTGRYESLGKALNAIKGMSAVQPDIIQAAVAYPPSGLDDPPDVVIISVKPKQALLAIQGLSYLSGNRVNMSTIGIRGVCADLTAEPFLNQRINGSFYCLGARALGGWEGDYMGLGMPLSEFEKMVEGMEKSAKGFPYKAYPA
jgi:uncharacterized protein (DUF169 family)